MSSYYNHYHNQVNQLYQHHTLTPETAAPETLVKVGNCAYKCFECMDNTTCSPCTMITQIYRISLDLMMSPIKLVYDIIS